MLHTGDRIKAATRADRPAFLMELPRNFYNYDVTGGTLVREPFLGLGGLGHLRVQFSSKMGFHTIVMARGQDEAELATTLGGRHYIDSTAAGSRVAEDWRRQSHPGNGDHTSDGRDYRGLVGRRPFNRARRRLHADAAQHAALIGTRTGIYGCSRVRQSIPRTR